MSANLMPIEIRPATSDDAPAMARVIVDTYLTAHRGQIPDDLWQTRKSEWTYEVSEQGWRRSLASIEDGSRLDYRIYVATDDGEVIALAAASPKGVATVDVTALYVRADHQGRGIGRQLLDTVTAAYTRDGFKQMTIGVLAANTPARRFYESLGGSVIEETEFDDWGAMLPIVVYGWDL